LKVLHISAFDDLGGAAQAAYRLHYALLHQGVESRFFVSKKKSSKPFVIKNESAVARFWENAITSLDKLPQRYYKLKQKEPFSNNFLPGMRIPKSEVQWADIIHLHWLGSGHIHPRQISNFHKPVVWRLPDMFAFTGGCHYSTGCSRYEQHCGQCPKLAKPGRKDISFLNWKRKNNAYSKVKNMTIVAPSNWLSQCAENSSLFQYKDVIQIGTGVNISQYKPIEKALALKALGLEHLRSKKIIAFGAVNAIHDQRKGYKQLIQAIDSLQQSSSFITDFCLLVLGGYKESVREKLPVESHYLGHLSDQISLNLTYNAADVFVVPSLEENLPNTGLEAMACGTPVVGFNVGGMPDLVDHKVNGFLATPYESDELSQGIQWVLQSEEKYEKLSELARDKIIKKFDLEVITKEYISLYNKMAGTHTIA